MNNSFNEHIANICGLELATLVGGYKYSVFGGTTAVVEGHRGIVGYLDSEVCFYIAGGILKIQGDNLKLKCLNKSFAVVVGRIDRAEVASK